MEKNYIEIHSRIFIHARVTTRSESRSMMISRDIQISFSIFPRSFYNYIQWPFEQENLIKFIHRINLFRLLLVSFRSKKEN